MNEKCRCDECCLIRSRRRWMMFSCLTLAVIFLLTRVVLAAPIDDLRAMKELPVPTYLWATPAEQLNSGNQELIHLTRVVGSIGIMAQDTTWRMDIALDVAGKAQALRLPASPKIVLSVVWRPWMSVTDPFGISVPAEFAISTGHARRLAGAIGAAAYKPRVVCLVDCETWDCREEPNRTKCKELYATYDALLRQEGCSEVHWYSFGHVPSPNDPDEWGISPWAAPFPGMESLNFSIVFLGEQMGKRQSSKKNRAYATSLGVAKTVAWIAAPGSGREYHWEPTYSEWIWDVGPKTWHDAEIGRELYSWWHRARPQRYMDPVNAIATYPHFFDSRIVDPGRKHLLAFLYGGTD